MPEVKEYAARMIRTLRNAGHQAYLVGGCVRDLLLEREPADYDVATDATPDEVMRIFPETFAVGAQFGVVLVPLPQEVEEQVEQQVVAAADGDEASPVSTDDHTVIGGHHHAVEVA